MKGVYVFLADGFEEIEAIAPVDVLRRGGVKVTTVGLNEDPFVTSSRRIPVVADMTMEEFRAELFRQETDGECGSTDGSDCMIFPGGMPGSKNLAACAPLMRIMNRHYADGGLVAAICAAPAVVLAGCFEKGVLEGKAMTCFDGFEDAIEACGAHVAVEADGSKATVACDGRIITAAGSGVSVDFALSVLSRIKGEETAAKVASGMML